MPLVSCGRANNGREDDEKAAATPERSSPTVTRSFIKAVYQRPVDTFDLSLRTSRHRVLVTPVTVR